MKIWKEAFDDKIFEKSLIIYVDDVVWNNVVTQFALKKLPNYKRKVINGADLSQAWFFEQNQNLSLFSEKTLWHILGADKISAASWKTVEENCANLNNNQETIFWFFFPLSSKRKIDLPTLKIDKVPFWEIEVCVKWFFRIMQVEEKKIDSYWPWDQELSLSEHWQLLEMYNENVMSLLDLKHYFLQQSFEQEKFQLLEVLDQKKWSLFLQSFKTHIERYEQDESLRLIQLIRSDVTKMAKFKENPMLVAKNFHEKKIFSTAQKWQQKDIFYWLKILSEWEILAKAGEQLNYHVAKEWLEKTQKTSS